MKLEPNYAFSYRFSYWYWRSGPAGLRAVEVS